MSESERYESYLERSAVSYEVLCKRCGGCCGLFDGDPCSQLQKGQDDRYFCVTYETRFGMQKTVSGKDFKCVPLRKILFEDWGGAWACGYKRGLKSLR